MQASSHEPLNLIWHSSVVLYVSVREEYIWRCDLYESWKGFAIVSWKNFKKETYLLEMTKYVRLLKPPSVGFLKCIFPFLAVDWRLHEHFSQRIHLCTNIQITKQFINSSYLNMFSVILITFQNVKFVLFVSILLLFIVNVSPCMMTATLGQVVPVVALSVLSWLEHQMGGICYIRVIQVICNLKMVLLTLHYFYCDCVNV